MAGATPEETDRLVAESIGDRDIDALLDLFELEALFVDPGTGAEVRGQDAIRSAVLEMFESDPVLKEAAPATVMVAGDVALVLSSWLLEVTGPDGQRVQQSGTATDVMRKQPDGTWRFVIDNPGGVERVSPRSH